jgi:hypothetical protein
MMGLQAARRRGVQEALAGRRVAAAASVVRKEVLGRD